MAPRTLHRSSTRVSKWFVLGCLLLVVGIVIGVLDVAFTMFRGAVKAVQTGEPKAFTEPFFELQAR